MVLDKAARREEILSLRRDLRIVLVTAVCLSGVIVIGSLTASRTAPPFLIFTFYLVLIGGVVVLLGTMVRMAQAIHRLGCVNCGAPKPRFHLPHRKCECCGTLLSKP